MFPTGNNDDDYNDAYFNDGQVTHETHFYFLFSGDGYSTIEIIWRRQWVPLNETDVSVTLKLIGGVNLKKNNFTIDLSTKM